jgi:hypothetical protein
VDDQSFAFLVDAVLPDRLFSVSYWRRNYVSTACPFAEIEQPAAVAAKREVCIGRLRRLLADGASELDIALAPHNGIAVL